MKLLIEVEVPDDVADDDPDVLARYLLDPRADDPMAVLVRARFAGLAQRHKGDEGGPAAEEVVGEQCPTCRVAYLTAGHATWCPNWVAPHHGRTTP